MRSSKNDERHRSGYADVTLWQLLHNIGEIVDLRNHIALQDVGRGRTIRHELKHLSNPVIEGQCYTIQYQGGRGDVQVRPKRA